MALRRFGASEKDWTIKPKLIQMLDSMHERGTPFLKGILDIVAKPGMNPPKIDQYMKENIPSQAETQFWHSNKARFEELKDQRVVLVLATCPQYSVGLDSDLKTVSQQHSIKTQGLKGPIGATC